MIGWVQEALFDGLVVPPAQHMKAYTLPTHFDCAKIDAIRGSANSYINIHSLNYIMNGVNERQLFLGQAVYACAMPELWLSSPNASATTLYSTYTHSQYARAMLCCSFPNALQWIVGETPFAFWYQNQAEEC